MCNDLVTKTNEKIILHRFTNIDISNASVKKKATQTVLPHPE